MWTLYVLLLAIVCCRPTVWIIFGQPESICQNANSWLIGKYYNPVQGFRKVCLSLTHILTYILNTKTLDEFRSVEMGVFLYNPKCFCSCFSTLFLNSDTFMSIKAAIYSSVDFPLFFRQPDLGMLSKMDVCKLSWCCKVSIPDHNALN